MIRTDYRFKFFEWILLIFGFFLFLFFSYLYFTNYPIGRKWFGWLFPDELRIAGKLTRSDTSIKRSTQTDRIFELIEIGSDIYDLDTIVTGDKGSAVIRFEDGSEIAMGPNTMIKIQFTQELTLAGIQRAAAVKIVAGDVQAKKIKILDRPKPIPPPAPLPEKLLSFREEEAWLRKQKEIIEFPSNRIRMSVPDGSTKAILPVELRFNLPKNFPEVTLKLWKMQNQQLIPLINKPLPTQEGKNTHLIAFAHPGSYRWQVSYPGDQVLPSFSDSEEFSISPTFRSIKTHAPLIAGKARASNRLDTDLDTKFDITLNWTSFPESSFYEVFFYKVGDNKAPVFKKMVPRNSFILNEGKLFVGQIKYRVESPLASGFRVLSDETTFRFDFLPPLLTIPMNNSVVSRSDRIRDQDKFLFTWERTNFTKEYLFEMSDSPQFKKVVIRKMTKENFLIVKPPSEGSFWWRATSIGDGKQSPPSPPFKVNFEKI